MLYRLKHLDRSINVAIVGIGAMGKGLVYQCHITPGIKCVAVADINVDKAVQSIALIGQNYRVVRNLEEMNDTIRKGAVAICENGDLLAQCEMVHVFIESSNSIGPAARFAITALKHRKHLILMNSEIDLIFGPYLLESARNNGVIYTSCDGDQHGVIKRMMNEIKLWGFDIVMAGNIKGFLDRYSNPTKIIPEADKRNLGYKMATSYTDGTKLNIEMALVANSEGFSANIPGMLGPRANHVSEVFQLFDFENIRERKLPVVDYILGAEPGGGVFVIGYCDEKYQRGMLNYYKMGSGPFYLFYRPYHLCHIEAMACIAEAVLDGRSLLQPAFGFFTNVFSYAKQDLKKGGRLDGIGGYACYGLIENVLHGDSSTGLPICLAEDVTLKRDIARDERILMSDVHFNPDSFEHDLYCKALEISRKWRK